MTMVLIASVSFSLTWSFLNILMKSFSDIWLVSNGFASPLFSPNLYGLMALRTFSMNEESDESPRAIKGTESSSRKTPLESFSSTISKNSLANWTLFMFSVYFLSENLCAFIHFIIFLNKMYCDWVYPSRLCSFNTGFAFNMTASNLLFSVSNLSYVSFGLMF